MLREQKIKNLMAQPRGPDNAGPTHLWRGMAVQIVSLLGGGGFQSLYARSMFLARHTYPWLVPPAGGGPTDLSFAALDHCLAEQSAELALEANIHLMLTFTDIMASLIGEQLTDRILITAWGPEACDLKNKENENE